ncbi:19284_t:CDS:10 [Rhizophagus irregularis]|nr:19284_t:CDS:10 [Rhizophagus irregularis]
MSKASAVKIVPQKHIDEGTSFASTLKALEDPIPSLPAKPITISIVGAGQRGCGYAFYAKMNPQLAKVVAVAEPRESRRKKMQETYNIPDENVFSDWKELAKRPKISDAIVIATLDHLHMEPAIAFADLKYHILLEKPMSVNLDECKKITDAAIRNKIVFLVGHVLRYTPHNRLIKRIIDSGLLGNIINIQHLEPVGNWHFAHSYVRGNWRKEQDSCFSLMTKKISSFGNLSHFNSRNKPTGAGDAKRCLDCAYEPSCAYSAKKIYIKSFENGNTHWPVSVVTDVFDIEHLAEALKTGPYGRCVYECDNDVADHQVVNMEFASGATATVTMVAFTESICERKKEILNAKNITGGTDLGGHGGGDIGLMEAFLYAISSKDESNKFNVSGAEETFDSHLYVFAAEHSRRIGQVVNIEDFKHNTDKTENDI